MDSSFEWMRLINAHINLNLHITSIFHVVSRKRPETFGFSARHVIDLPSSSVVGTKLRLDFVLLLSASSYTSKEKKSTLKFNEKIFFPKIALKLKIHKVWKGAKAKVAV